MNIETQNLFLKVPEKKHAEELYNLLNDKQVAHWLGGTRSIEDIFKTIERESNHWVENDFGPWMAFDKVSNKLIGRGGIRYAEVQSVREVEIFYAILPAFWGKGLATEMAVAAIDIAKKHENISSIIVFTLPENEASQRVFQKAGFEYEKNFEHAGRDHVFYRLLV